MTLDNVIGLPMGVMPEEGTEEHRDWLRGYIIDTYNKVKEFTTDVILVDNYMAQMNLYQELYSECWIGTMQR